MASPDRTAFAALLVAHRRRLGLSQAELAERTEALRDAGLAPRSVTERTVNSLENISPARPRVPQPATVRSLAAALELAPGSPDYDRFVVAASDPGMAPDPDTPDAAYIAAGREPQVAAVARVLDAADAGAAGAAVVTGPAGIGKTRLLEHGCRQAIERHRALAGIWAACPRDFAGMAAHEAFRVLLGQVLRDPLASDDDLPHVNEIRLSARLPDVAAALADVGAALIGTLVPASAPQRLARIDALDAGLRRRLEELANDPPVRPVAPADVDAAIVAVLTAAARRGPLAIVIDDLHWADAGTRSSLDCLIQTMASRHLPIALLGSLRTGEQGHGDPPPSGGIDGTIDQIEARFPGAIIDLGTTVGGATGRAFVDAAVARVHREDLAERLFARTSGLPLFVMSFLRLPDITGTSLNGAIPGEIGAVFARQLRGLDPPARALLEAASVQGDEFLAEPAMAVAGLAAGDGERELAGALAAHLRPVGRIEVAPGLNARRYRFGHALLRDHVLGTLSHLQRSRLHLATADALLAPAESPTGAVSEMIALQLERAGALDRAATAWIAAGDAASLRSDYLHAREVFRHVRQLGAEPVAPAAHVQALIGVGNANRALGLPDDARVALRRARREADERGLHTIRANALVSLGVLNFDAGEMETGAARFGEAIAAYTRAGNIVEAGRATANLSLTLHGMGRYDEARSRAERAIALAESASEPAVLASAEIALANCWLDLGAYERASALYEEGVARNDAEGLTHHANICMLNIALCQIERERWDDADAVLDRVDAPDRKLVDRMRSVVAFNRAMVAEGRGDLEAARRQYGSARDIRLRLGQEPLVIDALAGLLRVATAAAELPEARALASEIDRRLTAHGSIGIEHPGRLYLALVEAHDALGNAAASRRRLDEAIALLGERADLLADSEDRTTYLTRPPAHRRLLALARLRGLRVPAPADEG